MNPKQINLSYNERMLVSNIIEMCITGLEYQNVNACKIRDLFKITKEDLYKLQNKFINPDFYNN